MALSRDPPYRRGRAHGLAQAMLVAIPIWVAVWLALVLPQQVGPITQSQLMLLAFAAVTELVLLRYLLRASRTVRTGRAELTGRGVAVVFERRRNPILRQSAMLLALTVAYLQYYFLDVVLQIESMSSVVVFLPIAGAG